MQVLRLMTSLPVAAAWASRSRRAFLSAVACAAATGCGDSTGVRTVPPGALSVTLSGVRSGQYVVNGAQPIAATPGPATFAVALESPALGAAYLIGAFRASTGGRQDMLNLNVRGLTTIGEYTAAGDLAFGIGDATGIPEHVYRIMTGTVRVTTFSRTRIVGEFSGVAVGGPFPTTFPIASDTVHLSAGTFDVPIIRR